MPCYFPWVRKGDVASRPLCCGRCHGCRLEHARQWAVRCMHEASLYDGNSFVTLTYRDTLWSLNYRDFQLFMKRLRFKFRPLRIPFFMSGEYGDLNSRPHFHACLFGLDFPDKVYLRTTNSGSKLYRSALLEALWPHGYSSIGMVNFESAAYVARYSIKKVINNDEQGFEEVLDPDSGEVVRRVKPFAHMSLRPAIGKEWIKRFRDDVYPSGKVVVNGVEARAPRYYDKFLRSVDVGAYMQLCHERSRVGADGFMETMPDRLEAREKVSRARLGLSRNKF